MKATSKSPGYHQFVHQRGNIDNIGYRDSIPLSDDQAVNDDGSTPLTFVTQLEINHALTILYVIVEAARSQDSQDEALKIGQAFGRTSISIALRSANRPIDTAGSGLLIFLTQVIAKLRWEESSVLPLPRVCAILRKCLVLLMSVLLGPPSFLEDHPSAVRGFQRPRRMQGRAS